MLAFALRHRAGAFIATMMVMAVMTSALLVNVSLAQEASESDAPAAGNTIFSEEPIQLVPSSAEQSSAESSAPLAEWQQMLEKAGAAAEAKQFAESETYLKQAIELSKTANLSTADAVILQQSLARVYFAQNKQTEAIATQKQVIALLSKDAAKNPEPVIEAQHELGQSLAQMKKYAEALQQEQQAKQLYQTHKLNIPTLAADLEFGLGMTELSLNHSDKAAAHFAEQDKVLTLAVQNKGLTPANPKFAYAQGTHVIALRHLSRLQNDPDKALAQVKKAQAIAASLGSSEDITAISTALKKDEAEIKGVMNSPTYRWNKEMKAGKAEMGKHQFTTAANHYEQALVLIKTQPNSADAKEITLTALGFSRLGAKQFNQAVAPLQEALTLAKKRLGANAAKDAQYQEVEAALTVAKQQSVAKAN